MVAVEIGEESAVRSLQAVDGGRARPVTANKLTDVARRVGQKVSGSMMMHVSMIN